MKAVKLCPHCGAKMVQYRHTFSKGLAVGLAQLRRANVATHIKSLSLTYSQMCNFQKLKYWDLVVHVADAKGNQKAGFWAITDTGRDFVDGKIAITKAVWTYRGERTTFDEKAVLFREYHDGYRTRPEYARDAKPAADEPPRKGRKKKKPPPEQGGFDL